MSFFFKLQPKEKYSQLQFSPQGGSSLLSKSGSEAVQYSSTKEVSEVSSCCYVYNWTKSKNYAKGGAPQVCP